MRTTAVLRSLLVSQTRQKLLKVFFKTPGEMFYVRQLVRLVDEEINSVRRELIKLKAAGVVTAEGRGNRLYYQANKDNSLFIDLVLLANKTTGLVLGLQKKLLTGKIWLVLAHPSLLLPMQKGKESIDLVIVGDASVRSIEQIIKEEEEIKGREINYMVMDKAELKLRRVRRDPVLVDFMLSFPFVIWGNPEGLI